MSGPAMSGTNLDTFEHDIARPGDGYAAPQLHTHAVVFNVTERDGMAGGGRRRPSPPYGGAPRQWI